MTGSPVSRFATRSEPTVGVSPPWNRSLLSSTRSAPAFHASITSSALPQQTSITLCFIRTSALAV